MKTRMRAIVVRERPFLWTVRLCGGEFGYELRAWGGGKNSPTLTARVSEYPAPAAVRSIIEYGLDRDWDPMGSGDGINVGAWVYDPASDPDKPRVIPYRELWPEERAKDEADAQASDDSETSDDPEAQNKPGTSSEDEAVTAETASSATS